MSRGNSVVLSYVEITKKRLAVRYCADRLSKYRRGANVKLVSDRTFSPILS